MFGKIQKENSGYWMDLKGVLVPLTAKWNEMMLHEAGFRYVDSFWRWMNFAGWIAIK